MTKKAWVEDGKIRDICPFESPLDCYIPEIAANYSIDVPDNAANGDLWDGVTITKPVVEEPPIIPIESPKVSLVNFLLLFTGAERVAARALRATDPIIDDFWKLLEISTTIDLGLQVTKDGVAYTLTKVNASGITVDVTARTAQILNNEAPI